MPCPHCGSDRTQEQAKTTSLGYRTFRCPACKRRFKERTGPPFTDLWVPTDIVFRVVLWRLRYPLSLRDLAEMFLPAASTSATRRCGSGKRWLRRKRRGKAGRKWHCDEAYVKIQGVWCYWSGAIDADGNLVDAMREHPPRHGCGQAVLHPSAGSGRTRAGAGNDGRARRLPARHPGDPGAGASRVLMGGSTLHRARTMPATGRYPLDGVILPPSLKEIRRGWQTFLIV